jgi:hypothetical protein
MSSPGRRFTAASCRRLPERALFRIAAFIQPFVDLVTATFEGRDVVPGSFHANLDVVRLLLLILLGIHLARINLQRLQFANGEVLLGVVKAPG